MWLLLDMGNSSTKAALHDGTSIRRRARFNTVDPDRDADFREWASGVDVERAGAVSVVPGADGRWNAMIRRRFGTRLEFFDHRSRLPFDLEYETPETLGSDRIAAAAAAWQLRGKPKERAMIAVDTGTAVTYEVITVDGRYSGGPIAPGPDLLRTAMHAGTAQLPLVDLKMPSRLIGGSSVSSIQAGIMAGFSDAVEGMLERLTREMKGNVDVVLTGGWAGWLKSHLRNEVIVEPNLVVLGVNELMKLV